MKKPLICEVCQKEYKYRTPKPNQQHFFCSTECYGKHQTVTKTGDNNPNFGKAWSVDQRKKQSATIQKLFDADPNYAYECGKSNRGVKFTPERVEAMHVHRDADSYRHYPTDQVRKVIGQKSKEKWTPEFRVEFRKTMEAAGHWVPLDQVHPYKLYYQEANWIGSMIEYFSDAERAMLTEHGIFGKQNTKGWVRDHIVPRKCGYEMEIPAFILRHPANLQFISHGENIRKGFADRKLTINEKTAIIEALYSRIRNYRSWNEQEICLEYLEKR